MDLRKRGTAREWILRYTALYLMVALPMIALLLISGKTLLWGKDAYYQQYTTLSYTGQAIRRLFSGSGFDMVDLSLGQGMDAIGTLAYYGLTDPTQWLGALFHGRGLELYYHALIFLYIYLSGLFFCVYARMTVLKRDTNPWMVASAGMMFAFCGYQTIGVIKNPYYAAGALYLVLMLICVERILGEKKWLMMALVTALMVFANFYLAFSTTLLTVFYILIRLAARLRTRGVRASAADGFILLGSYLLGLMLSMVVLLPVGLNYLSSGRVDVSSGYTDSLLHYPAAYYLKLLALFCAPYDYAGYWSLQSFLPLTLIGVLLLFSPARGRRGARLSSVRGQLRLGVALALAFICVPLAGKVFNGFGYVTNRWCYGYALTVCLAGAWALPQLVSDGFTGRRRLAIAALLWAGAMLVYALFARQIPVFKGSANNAALGDFGTITKSIAAAVGALALGVSALFVLRLERKRPSPDRAARAVALLTAGCCLTYSLGYGAAAALSTDFMESGVDGAIRRETAAAAAQIDDDGFYRVDAGPELDAHASLLDYRGTGYYWSLIPEWVTRHYTDLELGTQRWTFRLAGLGADRHLNALACVKYCLRGEEDTTLVVPGGYRRAQEGTLPQGEGVQIYENQYALPLGYVFEQEMSEAEYVALNPVEKRAALISCAVLEEGLDGGLESFRGELPVEKLSWTASESDGVELSDGEIRARDGGTITLRFEGRPDSETYLRIGGTQLSSETAITDVRIYTLSAAGANVMYVILPGGVFNYDQKGVCASIGYSDEGLTECSLRFKYDAVLRFDELEILSVPASYTREQLSTIRARGGWDANVEGNRAEGCVSLENPGILQISLPYSAGWTAWVDGEEAELFRCGGMYMGLRLDAGAHRVELRYETPGLRVGAWISLAGALIALALAVLSRRARRAA